MNKYIISTCKESIPCNPCIGSCKFGAITKESLVTPPTINDEVCVGCKKCVAECPGQSLYFFQEMEDGQGQIAFPYEFLPLPKQNEKVIVVDIDGQPIGNGVVFKVEERASYNKTPLVTVSGAREIILNTRSIRRGE